MVGVDKKSEPIIEPAPDRPLGPEDRPSYWDSAPGKAVRKGAKWGMVVGLIIAQYYISNHSPLGFYTGNIMLVFASCIGLASAIGAGIGWLSTQKIGEGDDDRSPPPRPIDPIE